MKAALASARAALLAELRPGGHWVGELSSSALSTATASFALKLAGRADLAERGRRWLEAHRNADGGFGDTVDSPSNVSTTALCWAALGAPAEGWLRREVGELTAPRIAEVIGRRYGADRTFSVPILTMCALAGRFGEGPEAWRSIPRLPFELAVLPRSWFPAIGLPVVSYALPALIAIGVAQQHHRPSWNVLRPLSRGRALRVLEAIQPASGGFLEAAPLTSFVAMSLAGSGLVDHPVTRKAVAFLEGTVRPDGSWPIDTNLATWVTTLAVQALGGQVPDPLATRDWLLRQQGKVEHPYTGAAPGGWAWTDLSGGVPDGDDTPGALLALSLLPVDDSVKRAAEAGVGWLCDLQNRDGGIPTFCRGWGKLPFDRSSPDLTAHAIRAWAAWPSERSKEAARRALEYLERSQRADGSWVPLWFGNQSAPEQENPVYGTSRVLLCPGLPAGVASRGVEWLRSAQNPDGGWGGAPGIRSTIEETALVVEALSTVDRPAAERGCRWLVERTAGGTRFEPSPIGLYFAKLWYSERLYPLIFTAAALRRAGVES